jgi:hypothetical protein
MKGKRAAALRSMPPAALAIGHPDRRLARRIDAAHECPWRRDFVLG